MPRPRTVKRIFRDLLDDAKGAHSLIAAELRMAPNRLRYLILHPERIACDEEQRLRDHHAAIFIDDDEPDQQEPPPCPSRNTDAANSPVPSASAPTNSMHSAGPTPKP